MKKKLSAILLFLITGIFCGYHYMQSDFAYSECYTEAGTQIAADDLCKKIYGTVTLVNADPEQEIRTDLPGDYCLLLKSGGYQDTTILHVQDTIAPIGIPVDRLGQQGEALRPEDFVTEIQDYTAVTTVFETEPDFQKLGSQAVRIILTDLGGNQTVVEAKLSVMPIVTEMTLEAGSQAPAIEDFLIGDCEAEFLTNPEEVDYSILGECPIAIRVDGEIYTSTLHIVDTVAPKLVMKDCRSFTGISRRPEDFVLSATDETTLSYAFLTEPDLSRQGEQSVTIEAMDAAGNKTEGEAKLYLEVDREAPVITGVHDIVVTIGTNFSYKDGVLVTDNCVEGLQLKVDNSAVKVSQPGTYGITYTATDASGNQTSESATITIRERTYDEASVYAMAAQILSRIISPDMSEYDKCYAIYRYVNKSITYTGSSVKGNWLRGAYEGMVDKKGDCFTYASTAKALLNCAGVLNVDVVKIPLPSSPSHHYWNLVCVGGLWYHLDTTPRVDHPTIFLWTESQLQAYSNSKRGSHNYDPATVPMAVQ